MNVARVSFNFFDVAGAFGPMLDTYIEGGPLHYLLDLEIKSYEYGSMDDSAQEGIHRDLHLWMKNESTSFPVLCSSYRLKQNLAMYKSAVQAGEKALFMQCWGRVRGVLNTSYKMPHRRIGMSRATFLENVYAFGPGSFEDWSSIRKLFLSNNFADDVSNRDLLALKTDYMKWTLEDGACYSLPAPDNFERGIALEDEDVGEAPLQMVLDKTHFEVANSSELEAMCPHRMFFVVLDSNPKLKKVSVTDRDRFNRAAAPVLVQEFHQWGDNVAPQIFAKGSLELVDAHRAWPYQFLRHGLQRWQSERADVQGCLQLESPTRFGWESALPDSCPTGVILERIAALGWKPGRDKADPHKWGSVLTFFVDNGLGKQRAYYLCILEIRYLMRQGKVTVLHCGQSEHYYIAVRHFRVDIPADRGARYYQCMLKSDAVP